MDYIIEIADQALTALCTHFKQYWQHVWIFFHLASLCEMVETDLQGQCTRLNDALSTSESYYI